MLTVVRKVCRKLTVSMAVSTECRRVCGYLTANDTCQTQVSHRDGLKLTGALLALKAEKYQLLYKQLAAASMAAASHDLCSTFRHDLKTQLHPLFIQ